MNIRRRIGFPQHHADKSLLTVFSAGVSSDKVLQLDTFAYCIYSALFIQSVQILLSRRRPHQKLHLCGLTVLFLLSTIHIAAAYAWAFITDAATTGVYEIISLRNPPPDLYGPDDPVVVHHLARLLRARYAIANALADAILIWRCYIIWGKSWRAVAFPCVAYVVNIGGFIVGLLPLLGPSQRAAVSVCIGTTFLTNVVASSLADTAGRIWWISRRTSYILSRNSRRTYANITAILVESGCIYPISIIVVLIPSLLHAASTQSVLITIAPVYHIVGISPTLIIVRVGLGVSTDDVEKTITTASSGPSEHANRNAAGLPLSTLRFDLPTTIELPERNENDSEGLVELSSASSKAWIQVGAVNFAGMELEVPDVQRW
ncbi:hypothetical protein B0H19DRAFT_1069903 [Mycena capillaripes]|nr:hypothetical protein B0H19DRAFT_1069903 [Mycena capillaripes]